MNLIKLTVSGIPNCFHHIKLACKMLNEKLSVKEKTETLMKIMIHNFDIYGEKIRLWQKQGETYEHILMKALGYAMFVKKFPALEIEVKVGLRYKPDLIAENADGEFLFWGECGLNSIRKTKWLLKHTRTEKLVLFKIGINETQLIEQLQAEIPVKYRPPDRLILINFVKDIASLTADKKIEKVSQDWFVEFKI